MVATPAIHCVPALEIDAHSGFRRHIRCHTPPHLGPARGAHCGLFEILSLGRAEHNEAEKENRGLVLHKLGSL